jgi:hypothetical protein
MKYTLDILKEILSEGGAMLVGEYPKYNQRMRIIFQCKCGKETTKRFEMLNVYRLPYCEECSKKIVSERIKETFMENYGVSNVGQNQEIKDKIKNSYQLKYGDHPKRTKEVHDKWMNTCMERYGGHPNQNPDVQAKAEKTSFKHRDYTMPSGKIVKIQGYENIALTELLQHFSEEEIHVGRGVVPHVKYTCNEGKQRVYYPDFYIEPLNTILEIKSDWTLQLQTCRLKEKAKAVLKAGYNFEVWIYNGRGQNKEILTF